MQSEFLHDIKMVKDLESATNSEYQENMLDTFVQRLSENILQAKF